MDVDPTHLRNIGIIAHIDAGKTTTTERILYYSGKSHRLGNVDTGNTTTDWNEEEQERGITIYSAAVSLDWKDHRINLIDTPGHVDFTAEVERSLRVLDGAVFVFDGVAGVQAQSETVWRQSQKYHVPCIAFINKLDKIGADFDYAVDTIHKRLGANAVPLQWPKMGDEGIVGVVDLVTMEYLTWPKADDKEDQGRTVDIGEIPEDMADDAYLWRDNLLSKLGDLDDSIAEAYLEDEASITPELLHAAIRKATLAEQIVPVLAGASFKNKGVQRLMDAVLAYLPSPIDVETGEIKGRSPKSGNEEVRKRAADDAFSALAFKTFATKNFVLTYIRVYSGKLKKGEQVLNSSKGKKERLNQIWLMHAMDKFQLEEVQAGDIVAVTGLQDTDTGDTLCNIGKPIAFEQIGFPHTVVQKSVEAKTANDKDKLDQVLKTIAREDPTFEVKLDQDTGQQLIAGMGELHLEVITNRMRTEFKVEANVGKPMVAYKETIKGEAEKDGHYSRVNQSGAEIKADVRVKIEIAPELEGVEVVSQLTKEHCPKQYHDAIFQEVRSALANGGEYGYPLIQARATILGATHYEGSSNEIAYIAAASAAVREAVRQVGTVMLEPIMTVTVETPEEYLGDIQGGLNRRRMEIEDVQVNHGIAIMKGTVPISEMFGYTTTIRSQSSGRANYSMEPLTYRPVPPEVQAKFDF